MSLHLNNLNSKLKTQSSNINNESVTGAKKIVHFDQSHPLTTFANYVETTYKMDYTQGTINKTDNDLDLAILGEELFVVQDNNNQIFYTRNGTFRHDAEGYIKNDQGYYLLAKNIYTNTENQSIQNWDQLERVHIQTDALSTIQSTSELHLDLIINFDEFVSQETTSQPNQTQDLQASQSNQSKHKIIEQIINIYDKMGTSHTAVLQINQLGAKEDKKIEILILDDTQQSTLYRQEATIDKNTNRPVIPITEISTKIYEQDIIIHTPTILMQSMKENSSQVTIKQNGSDFQNYLGLEIEKGNVNAKFTNDKKISLYKIGLVTFTNPEQLQLQGTATFSSSNASGPARLSNKHSNIKSSSLEASNVNTQEALLTTTEISYSIKGEHRILSTDNRLMENFLQETK